MNQLNLLLLHLAQSGAFLLVGVVIMLIGKKIVDWSTRYDDDDLIQEQSNTAVAWRNIGFYLALAIAMLGALNGESRGFLLDLKTFALDGLVATALLLFARKINESALLPRVNNDEAIAGNNNAVGILEFGSFLASGLVLNGAFSGEGGGLFSGVLFFFIGQIAIFVLAGLYESFSGINFKKLIGEGNLAAGIGLAGTLASFGFILRASIAGPFSGWATDLMAFAISAVSGIALILVFGKVADWLFLPSTDVKTEIVRDQNSAALLLTAGLSIAMALIVSAVL